MKRIVITASVLVSTILAGSSFVSASTLENESIGIKMEIDDNDQLTVISQDLTHFIENEYSWTSFQYDQAEIASLMVLTKETEEQEQYENEYKSIVSDGSYSYLKTEQNGYVYFLMYLNADQESEQYQLIDSILTAFDQAEYTQPVASDISHIDFNAAALDGTTVSNDIFQDKELTVINIWATWCNPCLNELPLLAEWEKELPDQVQVLYLDYETEGIESADKDMIDTIIEKTGITRDNIFLYEHDLSATIDSLTQAFPTTIFVDKEGNLLSDIVVGAYVERYKEIVDTFLANQ